MKTFTGIVFSDKMAGSATVLIERRFRHPMYGKILKLRKKLHAVNDIKAKIGQKVEITEIKPKSKTICFKISKILDQKDKK